MPQAKTKIQPCPACNPSGRGSRKNGSAGIVTNPAGQLQNCPVCGGDGSIPADQFPIPQHLIFPLTVAATGPAATFQKKIANDEDKPEFRWLLAMISAVAPNDLRFIQLQLQDTTSTMPFQDFPVDASLFAGDGKLPFSLIQPYPFGRQTNLQLTGTPKILPSATTFFTAGLGVGDGATTSFAATLQAPVLPGSVTVTAGAVSVTDNGSGLFNAAGGTGTINYQTGALSFKFAVAPANSVNVTAAYQEGIASNTVQVDLWGYLMLTQVDTQQQPGSGVIPQSSAGAAQ